MTCTFLALLAILFFGASWWALALGLFFDLLNGH